MSEAPPPQKPPEAPRTQEEIEREEAEMCEAYLSVHPVAEVEQISPEACAERVAECEAMMASFEQAYDLEALRAIAQFSSREERESSPRQPALDALGPIFGTLKYLYSQQACPNESRDALRIRYERLSQAVGDITADKEGKIFDIVVHDRRTLLP